MRIALLASGWKGGLDRLRPYLTPTGDERWDDVEYVPNPPYGLFDGLVVCQGFRPVDGTFSFMCPPSRTLLVVKEPPEVLTLPHEFTRQFACVISQNPRIRSPRAILSHSAHHWFVEVPFAEALSEGVRPKTKLLSAVTSNKTDLPGHRQRLRFLAAVKERFGDSFDWFGRGGRELGLQKRAGLLDYKYHLCLENTRLPHYWTEKLADAYVSNCVPLYWGAPNIEDYFDLESLVVIDIYDIRGSIARIEQAIDKDLYAASQEGLATARRKILRDYHPYEVYARTLRALPSSSPRRMTIRPHNQCSFNFRERMGFRKDGAIVRIRKLVRRRDSWWPVDHRRAAAIQKPEP
jgi:hypothetical protein